MLPIKLEDRYAPLVTREIKEKAETASITTLWGSFIRERLKEAVVLLVVLSLKKNGSALHSVTLFYQS